REPAGRGHVRRASPPGRALAADASGRQRRVAGTRAAGPPDPRATIAGVPLRPGRVARGTRGIPLPEPAPRPLPEQDLAEPRRAPRPPVRREPTRAQRPDGPPGPARGRRRLPALRARSAVRGEPDHDRERLAAGPRSHGPRAPRERQPRLGRG